MKRDFTTQQFLASDLQRATGLSHNTVQNWLRRGLVKIAGDATPGHGGRRLYSAGDIIEFALVGKLVTFGIPVAEAAEIIDRFLETAPDTVGELSIWRKSDGTLAASEYASMPDGGTGVKLKSAIAQGEADVVLQLKVSNIVCRVLTQLDAILAERRGDAVRG